MIIITTESGLKKALNNNEAEILIQGNLAENLYKDFELNKFEIKKIMESSLFKITPKIIRFYKCTFYTNALVNIIDGYSFNENNKDKSLMKLEIKKDKLNKKFYWK